jgi:hypothetical protein
VVESSAISALESAASDLGKLLNGWTSNLLAESEAADSDPVNPDARSRRPDLATINDGIQSLWRLVSIQKSIQQLKNPPSTPAPLPDRSIPEFRSGVQTSVCSAKPATDVTPTPSPAIHASQSTTIPASVPSVPVVASAPTYRSIEAIAAKTEKLYTETLELISATGIPVPVNADLPVSKSPLRRVAFPGSADSNGKSAHPIKTKLLDAIIHRPTFPGSGNLIQTLLAELQTSPP